MIGVLITGVLSEVSVWNGVVVTPSEKVYEKPEEKENDAAVVKMEANEEVAA